MRLASETVVPVRSACPDGGRFRWPGHVALAPGPWRRLGLDELTADLLASGVDRVEPVDAPAGVTLRFTCDQAIKHREGYRLTIQPTGVTVAARAEAGAYYAVQTLRELMRTDGSALPTGTLDDWPDFARRGVLYDCSRGKVPTVETVKEFVTQLAHWKINELQLYIENVFAFQRHPGIWRNADPFTPADIEAIRQHCRLHHVRLVPAIATFGHFERILAVPEYQSLAELPGFQDYPGGRTLCATDPRAWQLVSEMLDEFLPLFDAEDVNVCCDETWELGKGRSRAEAERVGVGRLYLNYLEKLHAICDRHGKRMNAWADIVLKHPELLGDAPRDMVLGNWDYAVDGALIPRTREIADAGLPFLVAPGTSGWLSHTTRLPNALGNIRQFAQVGRTLGAEGCLNTDWGDFGHRNTLGISLPALAYGAAQSWHGQGTDDHAFLRRLARGLFGPDAEGIAQAIDTLGHTYQHAGPRLYHILVEATDPEGDLYGPIRKPSPVASHHQARTGNIDAACLHGLETARALLASVRLPDVAPRHNNRFAALVLDELRLARDMDQIACEKALLIKRHRHADGNPGDAMNALADRMTQMIDHFRAVWLSRNRVSSLGDNQTLLHAVVADLRRNTTGARSVDVPGWAEEDVLAASGSGSVPCAATATPVSARRDAPSHCK